MLKDIKNWKRIPTETYKNILDAAKIRYSEMMSQSQNITDKIIKMIFINSAIMLWSSKIIIDFKQKASLTSWTLLMTVIALNTVFIFWNISKPLYGRKAVLIGSSPK